MVRHRPRKTDRGSTPVEVMRRAPGCVGFANPSGWMSSDIFVKWLNHFIEHTNASINSHTLLLLDNHESHISVAALDLAKSHGITMLSFPPQFFM